MVVKNRLAGCRCMMHRFHCSIISVTELDRISSERYESHMSKPVTLSVEESSALESLVESINS
jgi:hypothetical protein